MNWFLIIVIFIYGLIINNTGNGNNKWLHYFWGFLVGVALVAIIAIDSGILMK